MINYLFHRQRFINLTNKNRKFPKVIENELLDHKQQQLTGNTTIIDEQMKYGNVTQVLKW